MISRAQKRGWRIARLVFRGVRIAILLLILAAVIGAIWLNQVGVPGFLKERIRAELRLHGMDVQFRQMRLLWYRGIVAEEVQFGQADQPVSPRVSAIQAELRLGLRALLRRRLELNGVVLHGGRVALPVWDAPRPRAVPRELEIEQVGGELKFHPGDQWELVNFQAQAFGVKLRMQGTITNASMLRTWRFWRERPGAKTAQAFWSELLADFEKTRFEPPSEILITITGDALDPQTLRASVNVSSPAVESPWGRGKALTASAQIAPEPGHLLSADVKLQASDTSTRWGEAASLKLAAQIAPSLTRWTPTNAHIALELAGASGPWGKAGAVALKTDFRPSTGAPDSSRAEYEVRAQRIDSRWGRFARAQLTGVAVVSSSNLWPSTVVAALSFAGGEGKWGRAANGSVEGRIDLPSFEAMEFSNTNVSWWTRADKVRAEMNATLADVHSTKLDMKSVSLSTDWESPRLRVRQVAASVFEGALHGTVQLDTATREVAASARTTFDPRLAAPLLSTNARRWLSHWSWEEPPNISASLNAVLPSWTDRARPWKSVDWRNEVVPLLKAEGAFITGTASFRDVSVVSAASDVTFSNFVWRLPNLKITRPEGSAALSFVSDEQSREFQLTIDSRIDPKTFAPWLAASDREWLAAFSFTQPPLVRAQGSGTWHAPPQFAFRGEVHATNFSFRAQPVLECNTTVTLTNRVLTFEQPRLVRGEGSAAATRVWIDFERERIFIQNATGSIDVAELTLAIGTNVARTMEPYRFLAPPVGWADGVLDLRDDAGTDLRFGGTAGPFQWNAFRFQQLTGEVHWLGNNLTLSNVQGALLGGRIEGSAAFNFEGGGGGTDFSFRTLFHAIDLQSLMREVGRRTNRVEGTLSGTLAVTDASTESFQSWQGHGRVSVQDGLLWDFPVFGVFSPLLNAVKPGAGNSRAKEVTATFGITNSVISSTDLQIHASGMRLLYDGTIDFNGKVNGRMEAQLFRDAPALGTVVSKVLWPVTKLFEYRIGGTLAKPAAQPLYIPKILLMPFHPLRTLRELMGGDDASAESQPNLDRK